MAEVGTILLYTFFAVLQILIYKAQGVKGYLRSILTRQAIACLSSVTYYLFIPLFCFLEISRMATMDNIKVYWILAVATFISLILKVLLCWAFSVTIDVDQKIIESYTLMCAFPALGSLTLVLGKALCYPGCPLDGDVRCNDVLGLMMIIFMIYSMIFFLTSFVVCANNKNKYTLIRDKLSYIWYRLINVLQSDDFFARYLFTKYIDDNDRALELFDEFKQSNFLYVSADYMYSINKDAEEEKNTIEGDIGFENKSNIKESPSKLLVKSNLNNSHDDRTGSKVMSKVTSKVSKGNLDKNERPFNYQETETRNILDKVDEKDENPMFTKENDNMNNSNPDRRAYLAELLRNFNHEMVEAEEDSDFYNNNNKSKRKSSYKNSNVNNINSYGRNTGNSHYREIDFLSNAYKNQNYDNKENKDNIGKDNSNIVRRSNNRASNNNFSTSKGLNLERLTHDPRYYTTNKDNNQENKNKDNKDNIIIDINDNSNINNNKEAEYHYKRRMSNNTHHDKQHDMRKAVGIFDKNSLYDNFSKSHKIDNNEIVVNSHKPNRKTSYMFNSIDKLPIDERVSLVKHSERHFKAIEKKIQRNEEIVDRLLLKPRHLHLHSNKYSAKMKRSKSFDRFFLPQRKIDIATVEKIYETVDDPFYNDKLHIKNYFDNLFAKIDEEYSNLLINHLQNSNINNINEKNDIPYRLTNQSNSVILKNASLSHLNNSDKDLFS